jgi:site-specific DNA recombinase
MFCFVPNRHAFGFDASDQGGFQMNFSLNPPLTPKSGSRLEIIIVCRVSNPGPGKQDIRSLEDQEAQHRQWVKAHTSMPFKIHVIAGSGSGESLERREYEKLIELIETGLYDLVLVEDIGRIVRRIHAHLVCEICVDTNTRLIARNDNIDTATVGWEDRSIFSAWHHERSNRDTSERIKRTQRNRFMHGGCLPGCIFGYRRPPGAKSDHELERLAEYEPVYRRWFEMLDQGAPFSEVADWLNANQVPTGDACRQDKWDCKMVSRVTRNPLLKGVRQRNRRRSRRNNKTGRYISERAPEPYILSREVPRLAFVDADLFDRVQQKLRDRNRKYRRSDHPQADPLLRRPKKRTRFPGQSVRCGICGRLFVFGGHGQTHRLMCNGAREYKCWNSLTFDGRLAAERLSQAVLNEIAALPDFETRIGAMIKEEWEAIEAAGRQELKSVDAKIQTVERRLENLVRVLSDAQGSPTVVDELKRLEAEKAHLESRREEVTQAPEPNFKLPTMSEIRRLAKKEIGRLAIDSPEFARLLRQLLPSILVYPVKLVDGETYGLRAKADMNAAIFATAASSFDVVQSHLQTTIELNLFASPQREAFREQVMELRSQGQKVAQIAARLGITKTAVDRAAAVQRKLEQAGRATPWLPVAKANDCSKKMRRQQNKRFHFEPLPGFPKALNRSLGYEPIRKPHLIVLRIESRFPDRL